MTVMIRSKNYEPDRWKGCPKAGQWDNCYAILSKCSV